MKADDKALEVCLQYLKEGKWKYSPSTGIFTAVWERRRGSIPEKVIGKQTTNGYIYLRAMINRKVYMCGAHRVAFFFFNPNADRLLVINHKDNNRTNNQLSNLELVTQQENVQYCILQKRNSPTRERKSPRCKVSDEQVAQMQELKKQGFLNREIATKFSISTTQVTRLLNGTRRPWLKS